MWARKRRAFEGGNHTHHFEAKDVTIGVCGKGDFSVQADVTVSNVDLSHAACFVFRDDYRILELWKLWVVVIDIQNRYVDLGRGAQAIDRLIYSHHLWGQK